MPVLIALLLQAAAPAPCATPAPLPASLAGWRTPRDMDGGDLSIGHAYRLMLGTQDSMRFAVPPERAAPAGRFAGGRGLVVRRAGTYRVLLDSPAWIDMVRGGRAMASAAHRHGLSCSGIAKQVDFRLTPGRYVLQLSGARSPALVAMVARVG